MVIYLDSCDKRYCLYSLTSNSLMSTSSKSAILSRQATSGWEVLVHHLLTVDGLTPSCSESHLLVRFFSKRTIFILFTSSIFIAVLCYKDSEFVSRYAKVARLFSLYLCFFTNLSELSFGFVRLPILLLSFVGSVKLNHSDSLHFQRIHYTLFKFRICSTSL